MNRRQFLQSSALASQAAAAQQQPNPNGRFNLPEAAQPATKPNVIWVFGDQHRAQALGCNGDVNARTPNIDRLANDGVSFTNALSGFPLCCPYRGSLLTSRYPHKCVPGHEMPLPDGQKTIAHAFAENGYKTAWFGKWHLFGWKEANGRGALFVSDPDKRGGFETWTGYENNNSQWDSWVHGGAGKDAFHYRLPGYETDELTNLFIKYLKERGEDKQPFFAALSVQPPHDPYVAPEEFMARYNPAQIEMRPNLPNIKSVTDRARREAAGYYAMIENLDWNLGRIRKALQQSGLDFNTHIVFFSDHGDMHGSQGMFRKTNPFEESIRVPFIIGGEIPRYQGRANGRQPAMLNHVDVAPTTLGLCGIQKPSWMEGYDFSRYRLSGRSAAPNEPDSAYLQNVIPTGHFDSINTPYRGVVTKDGWKFVSFENQPWLLFNLNEDPYEQRNLAFDNRYAAERKKLIARLAQWIADTGDRFSVIQR
jgi:arylsulfatase A-like enzyme